jgi:hypothetical protein
VLADSDERPSQDGQDDHGAQPDARASKREYGSLCAQLSIVYRVGDCAPERFIWVLLTGSSTLEIGVLCLGWFTAG